MTLPHFRARISGSTSWSVISLVGLSVEGLTSFSVAPLRFASLLGVLLASAAVVAVFDKRRDYRKSDAGWTFLRMVDIAYYGFIAIVFSATMLWVALGPGSGLGIGVCFILAILLWIIPNYASRIVPAGLSFGLSPAVGDN